MAFETRENCKLICISREGRDDNQNQDFMVMAGLGVTEVNTGGNVQNNSEEFECMMEKMKQLDNLVSHIPDMLSTLKCKSGVENMVVEIEGEVFKGEVNVRAWVEANLPTSH
eukprot:1354776-Ditylum_brightwellii.AAC.1